MATAVDSLMIGRVGVPAARAQPDAVLAHRLRWLIALRIVVITSALVPFFFLQLVSEELQGADFTLLYLLAGSTYAASLLYILLLRLLHSWTRLQAYIQFGGDLLLISGLVCFFGGPFTPFSILYLVVVIVASSFLPTRAGLSVAVSAWLLYSVVAVALYTGALESPISGVHTGDSIWRLSYNLAVHLFGFYAVALMTSRLAQTVTTAERELREERESLADLQVVHRDVIESIPSGLITTDRNGTITSVNRAAERILRRRVDDLVGEPIEASGLLGPDEFLELSALAPEQRSRRELEYRHAEQVIKVGFALSSLTTEENEPRGHILIFQDLSKWQKLQEELQLKDRMAAIGQLAAGIAHEIGNPLAAISGSVQMLSRDFEGRPAQGKLLEILVKESQRLDRTIKGFLKFARPKDRSLVHFDIAALLSENMELLRNSPEVADEHRLSLELEPEETSILADPDQVSQIFWNLARNALRAMPGGGSLGIRGRLRGDTYRITFIDTGHGMSDEERANVFHPFRSSFDGGTGLGMAIVYQIVQEHGGRLLLESGRGRGTEITVELPAEQQLGPRLRVAEG